MPLGGPQYFVTAMTKLTKHENAFSDPVIPNHFRSMNHLKNLMKISPSPMGKKGTHKILDKTKGISCLERYVDLRLEI